MGAGRGFSVTRSGAKPAADESTLNALGEPSPNRTDFKQWDRENLERFARQAADENLILRSSLRVALDAWRDMVRRSAK